MNIQKQKSAVALGFFDGVHVGHARLLSRAVEVAKEKGYKSSVFTFDRHPTNLITGHPQLLLNTVSDRAYIMRKYNYIDEVVFSGFDDTMMHMPWKQFIEDILINNLNAGHIVVGYDFRFGYKGEGNVKLLQEECAKHGIGFDIIPRVEIDGITVSSTYIRKLIAQGDMDRATLFLGHPHILSNKVEHGKKIGRTLGIPTINMLIPPEIQEPKKGVYMTRVIFDNNIYLGVTNIGSRPTVTNAPEIVVETYIINYDGDLYGKNVIIEFIEFLRDETKFPSLDAMKFQIDRDILYVKSKMHNLLANI